ncbi:hypothetical protein FCJ61_15530 [Burkholderia metallica]|uniref:hypothetical protein n=1 Tax=Burkholderia metallica TaxID=488729 RepID=UPI00157B8528|nr:hypothetical protein [Burkholderia metallica]NTZ84369.1 hypothetical protein [Burkholderia metallica]
MKSIKFLRRVPPYQAGEIAGFPDRDADRLIEAGAAEEFRAPRRGAPRGARSASDPSNTGDLSNAGESGTGSGGEGGPDDSSTKGGDPS